MRSFKSLPERFKNLIDGKDKKKLVENAIILVIIGIVIIIAGGAFFGGGEKKAAGKDVQRDKEAETVSKSIDGEQKADLEKRLESILSQIEGAGRVSVMITYASGKEIVPAVDTKKTENETQEKDSGGGTRHLNQNDYESRVIYEEDQGGVKRPVIIKEIQPQVKGVVIVADGAGNAQVRENLSRAVQALMDVPIHKIQVFERKN